MNARILNHHNGANDNVTKQKQKSIYHLTNL